MKAHPGDRHLPHNRFKNRGYTVTRDQHGTWHHYRPDGTEVCPLDINPEV